MIDNSSVIDITTNLSDSPTPPGPGGSSVYSENNGALTVTIPSGSDTGTCTWSITHNLNTTNVGIHVYDLATGEEVACDKTLVSSTVAEVTLIAIADIPANTYKVVVIGG